MADRAAGGDQRRNGGGNPATQAQAAYAHARAYDHAVAYVHARAYVSLAVKGSGLLALLLSSVILLGGYVQSLGKKDFLCITSITVIQSAGSVISSVFLNSANSSLLRSGYIYFREEIHGTSY